MSSTERRYDIDFLRVVSIGLLLVYHSAISFQSWGVLLGFITNGKSLDALWIPMTMLNIWRIPLLFFISGIAVYFSFRNRNWKLLLLDRSRRILIPYLVGIFLIVPLQIMLVQYNYRQPLSYQAHAAHLWFLGNIMVYLVVLLPLFSYLKRMETAPFSQRIKQWLNAPTLILLQLLFLMVEVLLLKPILFEMYAMTWHGFFLGMIAFLFGYLFSWVGFSFWQSMVKWRWLFLMIAICLYAYRIIQLPAKSVPYLLVLESNAWILAILAIGNRYFNKGSRRLSYLSRAAYPVYIVHLFFQFLVCLLLFPLEINLWLKFILVVLFTILLSLLSYEWILRRFRVTLIIFGIAN
ncbi:acyltransferase family protein [Flavihumibacter sp. UBA7668]|uniref:acyltransferase family protein n=1 Tax=Flavihumibacter sp. UBA7668 TaxID=1946542 RepID=UPI0025BAF31F|nr:acyltransferase family protein [Flavihumibacter sp. UBA7668]